MSGAVTFLEMPGEAELMLELQGGHLKANKRQHSPRKRKLYAYISKCIFSSSNYKTLLMDNA